MRVWVVSIRCNEHAVVVLSFFLVVSVAFVVGNGGFGGWSGRRGYFFCFRG